MRNTTVFISWGVVKSIQRVWIWKYCYFKWSSRPSHNEFAVFIFLYTIKQAFRTWKDVFAKFNVSLWKMWWNLRVLSPCSVVSWWALPSFVGSLLFGCNFLGKFHEVFADYEAWFLHLESRYNPRNNELSVHFNTGFNGRFVFLIPTLSHKDEERHFACWFGLISYIICKWHSGLGKGFYVLKMCFRKGVHYMQHLSNFLVSA